MSRVTRTWQFYRLVFYLCLFFSCIDTAAFVLGHHRRTHGHLSACFFFSLLFLLVYILLSRATITKAHIDEDKDLHIYRKPHHCRCWTSHVWCSQCVLAELVV